MLFQFDHWEIKTADLEEENSKKPGIDRPGTVCSRKHSLVVTDTYHNSIKEIHINHRSKKQPSIVEDIYCSSDKNNPGLLRPQGIAVSQNGDVLYIADTGHHMIKKLEGGLLTDVAGCGLPGLLDGKAKVAKFNQPCALEIDSKGNLIVADTENNAIRKVFISAQPVMVETIQTWNETQGIGLYRPTSLTLFKDTIFVAQPNHRIMKISDGLVSLLAGSGSIGRQDGYQASFNNPMGILYFEGLILVCDWGNHKIRAVDIASKYVTTAAGSGEKYGPLAKLAKQCTLPYPRAIGRASDGTIWISTSFNFQVIDCAKFLWQTERLLWIGHLKNSPSDCLLASIPREIVREIIRAGNK